MKQRPIYLLLATVLFFSCNTPKFQIEGNIFQADGKMLYLEQLTAGKIVVLDSMCLKANGKFRFKEETIGYAELYRLRIDRKQLILAVDSTETIYIETSLDSLSFAQVKGSETTNRITSLRHSLLTSSAETHKQYARELILSDPRSLAAYYALFQQKAGEPVFDVFLKEDRPYFSAVATAWNAFMPDNPRSKTVYRLTLETIQNERKQANRISMQEYIAAAENAFLDISLPDENGKLRYLSDLRGTVFVLDFSAIDMEQSSAYIFELREIYNRYHQQGFEIYSVSADRNRLLWEDSAQNLPWITVCGENGAAEHAFMQYNVQSIPTLFLFNRQGEIVGRYTDFTSLSKAIDKCLN